MRYKVLGFVVWQGARWYARRRIGYIVPSRRVVTGALVVGAVAVGAAIAARSDRD